MTAATCTRIAALTALLILPLAGARAEAQAPPFDAARREALDAVLEAAVAAGELPGVVVLVTTRDRVLHHRAYGAIDPVAGRALTPDALFDIASMTKPLTSLAALMLVDEGRLALDAPAERYLPELAGRAVLVGVDSATRRVLTRPAARPITVRDLLRHTSGIAYPFSNAALRRVERLVPYREWPLVHDPGERWTYGMGTAPVGWIIEQVAGMPLEAFLRERIFGPLGMDETSFSLSEAQAPRLMTRSRRRNGALVPSPRPNAITAEGQGDGDLISSAADYARFLQFMLGDGTWRGRRLLSVLLMDEFTRDQLGGLTVEEQRETSPGLSAPFPAGGGRDGFSLGFQVARGAPDGRPDGTLSWGGLYNTHFWIDRTNGLGVLVLTQLLPYYDPAVMRVVTAVERTLYRPLGGDAR